MGVKDVIEKSIVIIDVFVKITEVQSQPQLLNHKCSVDQISAYLLKKTRSNFKCLIHIYKKYLQKYKAQYL